MDEINAQAEAQTERELHKHIGNLLRQRSIEFIESRMDRKTTQKRGVPDFLFSIWVRAPDKDAPFAGFKTWPVALAFELKLPGKKLDPEQVKMFESLSKPPNAWHCVCIHSVDEALAELKRFGL